ncbi:TMEM43 family protein [Dokdonella sp.]|uniref:TMEM43 family protein n=1 Tax=Dokdonella sp. TaxID=2291710 RepID=UPI0037840234
MARRAHRRGSVRPLLLALAVLALAAGAWYWRSRHPMLPTGAAPAVAPVAANADRVDPRNEGRTVSVSGTLQVVRPARDTDLGVAVDAVLLAREVRMLQWQEHCAGNECNYALAWSDHPVDSHAFRDAQAHRNGMPFPFSSQRFSAGELRLGAYTVDPTLAAAGVALERHAVTVARLPPNLAATFRDCDGALCSGDPAKPAAGDLRVEYRIAAAGRRTLEGIQHGDRLQAMH